MAWTIGFHSEQVEADILAMSDGFVARFLHYAERMEAHGPNLGMPHTRAMGNGLFELRVKAEEGIARVFYVSLVKKRIVFLHQFVKKTEKTPKRELDIAKRRQRELGDD